MSKKLILLALACTLGFSGVAAGQEPAQDVSCFKRGAFPSRYSTIVNAARDQYHPNPYYAYGRGGITATREHHWNYQQAQSYAWHGDHSYWKYGTPTALVLPPTAAFMSNYQWGVGNTTSTPIHHQFQHQSSGMSGGGEVGGSHWTPYWPSHTRQFGLYGVRAPW
jgi:hypothetical protein